MSPFGVSVSGPVLPSPRSTGSRRSREGIRWVSARHAGQLMDVMLSLRGGRFPDQMKKARFRGPPRLVWKLGCQATAALPYLRSKKPRTVALTFSCSGCFGFL